MVPGLSTLDRYVLRQVLPAFALALAVFTFVLAIQPALKEAEKLLAKSVPLDTVAFIMVTLLPQALGLSIPMALLTGALMGLGRMSADREGVALLACGVSPRRLLVPLLVLAVPLGLINMFVMMRLIPDSNQAFRETTWRLLAQQGESDIKAGVFYEGFPGKVVFVRGDAPGGGWAGVLVADTTRPDRPALTLAEGGRLELRHDERVVNLWLERAARYQPASDGLGYDRTEDELLRLPIDPVAVYGDGSLGLTKGAAELDMAGLQALAAERVASGNSPHNEIMRIHQMFSFPVACLVFAVLAVPLGLHTRREGKLGGFTQGLAAIFVYWILLAQAEDLTKGGRIPAEWARWIPNIALAVAAVVLVWWRSRVRRPTIAVGLPSWLSRPGARRDSADTPAARPRPVVVIRFPTLTLPRPRLLDVYVARRYLGLLALSFVALLGLYYIGQFIDLADKLFKGVATWRTLFAFLLYSTPQFVAYLVPVATLVAVLGTIGALTRTSELTVMRACGISIYRVALPLFVCAAVWSGGLFLLEDRVLAYANRRADELNDVMRERTPRTLTVANRNWLAGEDGRIYYFAFFDPGRRSVHAASIYDTADRPYRLESHTFVRDAVYHDGVWTGGEAWMQQFGTAAAPVRRDYSGRQLPLAPIEDFERAQIDASRLTFAEQRRHVNELRAGGYDVARQEVELHKKLAFPLVTIVMTLLAVPFGLTTGRHGALYGIGLVIGLALTYHLLTTVFTAAGSASMLPPAMAAWAANILFLAAAGYLTLTIRT
ncbi:MAG TPA: LptF/LptG family permease [Vicinamibacterales bacterium]|nr:LptF/LptG family permease [Vicinamibacterales bacterium]